MSRFHPSPKKLVVNELIEKGYIPDHSDALRLCGELEEQEQTDGKLAIGLTAVGILGAGVTLAFAGVVAPLLVPIAAIGVGVMGAWNHPIRATRRDDEADFLRANPAIIPLIEAKLQSGEADFKIAAAYQECFRAWRNTGQPLALPSVGNASAVADPPDEVAAPSIVGIPTIEEAVDPVRFLAEEPKSQMIIGVTGGGKDLLMSNALRVLLQRFPTFTALVMDGKGDPKESGYWSNLPKVTLRSCCILETDRETAIAWVQAVLTEFKAMPSPKLLIVNEATTIRGLDSAYGDFAVHVASGGDSSAIYVWEAGQIAHTSALKIDGGRRSLFAPIALLSKKRPDQVDALLATGFTPKDIKSQAFIAMDASPVGRAWFDGRQWLPLPRLENYSGYDRDDLTQKFAQRETKSTNRATIKQAEPTRGDRQKLEELFKSSKSLPEADLTRFSLIANTLESRGTEDAKLMADFIRWLEGKQGELITLRQVQGGWGKKNNCRQADKLNQIFAVAIAQKFLTRIDADSYQVRQ